MSLCSLPEAINFISILLLFLCNFQVKWAPDNLDGYLNFYSVSGDGRVSNWTIVKTALWTNDTLLINFCKTLNNLGEESVSDLLMGKKIIYYFNFNTNVLKEATNSKRGSYFKC